MNQDLIDIKTVPATLDINFEALKSALQTDLQKYDIVVTADTVADAKKLATDINKTAQVLKQRQKEAVDEASQPIEAFKSQIKDLVKLCDDGRQRLLQQVKTFEDKTRAECRTQLQQRRADLWEDLGVHDHFRKAEVDDLVILSNLTTKGYLTAKAKGEVDARCKADLALQDQTRRRVMELENRSWKAGLDSPLTRDHVAAYLYQEEETYQRETDRIIEAEVKRQASAKAAERQRIEQEREAEEAAKRERQIQEEQRRKREQQAASQKESDAQAMKRAAAQNGQSQERTQVNGGRTEPAGIIQDDEAMVWASVSVTFVVQVPERVTDAQIESQVRGKMRAAGFESNPEVSISRGE